MKLNRSQRACQAAEEVTSQKGGNPINVITIPMMAKKYQVSTASIINARRIKNTDIAMYWAIKNKRETVGGAMVKLFNS